jgi:hypothetical protein
MNIHSGELAGSCWGSSAEEQIIRKLHEMVVKVRGAGAAPFSDGNQKAIDEEK